MGIVFVDATHPDEVEAQRDFEAPAILKAMGAINIVLKRIEKVLYEFKYSEAECMGETVKQIRNAGPFPKVPIAVVSGNKNMPFIPQRGFQTHLRFQEKLLRLSMNSRQYICRKSSHFPQITEPEVVISAINDTVDTAKKAGRDERQIGVI